MKRLIALLLALIFSLSILIGCAKKEEPQKEEETTTEQATPAETTQADTGGGY
jgi:preprotein translocase subunit SecG